MPVRIEEIPNVSLDDGFRIPKADGNAATAPARALGDVAESIASVGETFHGIARQAQENVNAHDVLSKPKGWDDEGRQFLAGLPQGASPADYLPQARQLIDAQRAAFESADFAPVVREKLTPLFEQHVQELLSQTAGAAARITETMKNRGFMDSYDQAVKKGSESLLRAHLEVYKQGSPVSPQAEAEVLARFRRDREVRELNDDLEVNPAAAHQALNARDDQGGFLHFQDMGDIQRASLSGAAQFNVQQLRREEAVSLRDPVLSGAVPPEEARRLAPNLQPGDFRFLDSGRQPATLKNASDSLLALADLHQAYDQPTLSDTDYHSQWTTTYLSVGSRTGGILGRQIDDSLKHVDPVNRPRVLGGGSPEAQPPDPWQDFQKDSTQRIGSALRSGFLGPYQGLAEEEQTPAMTRHLDLAAQARTIWQRNQGDEKAARSEFASLLGTYSNAYRVLPKLAVDLGLSAEASLARARQIAASRLSRPAVPGNTTNVVG